MSYPHESALSAARRRRHRRAVVTLTLVVLALVGGFGYSLAYYQGWVGSDGRASAAPSPTPTPTPSCSVGGSTAGPGAGRGVLVPANITVNVYNATKRSGLAGAAARELDEHGFTVGAVANDPLDVEVRGVGQIRHGVDGTAQAKLVRHWLRGAELVLDGRTGTSVDLVIGDNYKALTPPPEAEQSANPGC